MSQTVNGENATEKNQAQQRASRPGQRQQERLQRIVRRRRRNRNIAAAVATVFLVALGSLGIVKFQDYTAQQADQANAHGTATAEARATASFLSAAQKCFISPNGQSIPSIYSTSATPSAGPTSAPALSGTPVILKDGLEYVDIKTGTGKVLATGNTITAEYTGWIANTCQKFDSSYDQGRQAFSVPIGKGQVIKGWDEGLIGMKPGGIRRLFIPAALGYGTQGATDQQSGQVIIPPGAILVFDVMMISAK